MRAYKTPAWRGWAWACAIAVSSLLSCGGEEESPCDAFATTYGGTMSGTVDGASFTAEVQLTGAVGALESRMYGGTFTGTGDSAGIGGSFHFNIDCASGALIEEKGWYVESTDPEYWRGEFSGTATTDGASATGSWECTYGCTGTGSFTLSRR